MAAEDTQYLLRLGLDTGVGKRDVDNVTDALFRAGDAADRVATRAGASAKSTKSYAGASRQASSAAKSAATSTGKFSTSVAKLDRSMGKMLRTATAVVATWLTFSTASAAVTEAVDIFTDVETALVAVAKTTGITGGELRLLEEDVTRLSATSVPELTTDLLDLGAAAGQLGVEGSENILNYIETIAKLGAASDLQGENAAKVLTRILNVQGEAPEQIERLASVLVRLGNNSAATESEIARITNEVSLATASFNLGSTRAAAYGAALAEIGVRAELGGSVLGRTMREIQMAVGEGGAELLAFADVAGLSAEEFTAAWAEDPSEALDTFIRGLGRFGADAGAVLEKLGLGGEEVAKVLPPLAANFEKLAEKQRLAADEAVVLTALEKEAAAAFGTTRKDLQRLENSYQAVAKEVGRGMAPALREVTLELRDFLLSNREAALELGQTLGEALRAAADLFLLLAKHAGIGKAALLAFLALKIATFFTAFVAGVGRAVVALTAYTASTTAATGATALFGKTVARTSPILDQYGKNIVVTTTATRGFLSTAITPLTIGLTALLGAVLFVNSEISGWSDSLQGEIDEIVSSSESFFQGIQNLKDASADLLDTAKEEAEVRRRLLSAGVEDGSDEATRIRAQVAADLQRDRVALLVEQESKLAEAEKAEEDYRTQLDATAESVKALRVEFEAARQNASFDETGNINAPELDRLSGELAAAESQLESLTNTWNQANITINEAQAVVDDLTAATKDYTPASTDAARAAKLLTEEQEKQLAAFAKLKAEIIAETQALEQTTAAYRRNDGSLAGVLDKLDLEARMRGIAIKLTKAQRVEIEGLIRTQTQAARTATGAETIRDLEDQLEAQRLVTAAYRDGAEAVASQLLVLEAEETARGLVAVAAANQAERIRELVDALQDEARIQAFEKTKAAILEESDALERLNAAYTLGAQAVTSTTAVLRVEAAIREAAADATGDHADELERVAAARERERALLAANEQVAALEEEARFLSELAAIKREDFDTEAAFEDAIRRVNAEREVRVALLAIEAQHMAALTAIRRQDFASEEAYRDALAETNEQFADLTTRTTEAIRSQQRSREEVEDGKDAVSSLAQGWSTLASTVTSAVSSIDRDIGQMVGSIFNAVDAFRALAAAQAKGGGGLFSAESIAAGQGTAGLLGSLGLGGGGTSSFGGELSGTYADLGGQLGGLFGPVGAIFGTVIGSFFGRAGDTARIVLEAAQDGSGRAIASIRKAEGGLEEIAQQIAAELGSFVRGFEALTGERLSAELADLSIEIVDEVITVRVRGLVAGFRSLDEALSFAAEQLLKSQESLDGLGENVRRVFQSIGFRGEASGSLVDLEEALGLAQLADDIASGLVPTELLARVRDLAALREREIDLARRYGLAFADVLAVGDARLRQLFQEVEASRQQFFGVQDHLSAARDLAASIQTVIAATEEETQRRRQMAADAEARADAAEVALIDAGGSLEVLAVGAHEASKEMGLLRDISVNGTTQIVDEWGTGLDGLRHDAVEGRAEVLLLAEEARRAREEADALNASLADIPNAIDAQAIVDVFNAAASRVGLDLITLLRQVHGEQAFAAEQQHFAAQLYILQLAVQIQAVETLLAATETFDAATRAVLENLLDIARRTLEDLASGDITFTPPNLRPPPRPPAPPPSAPTGPTSDEAAAQRELERFAEELRMLRREALFSSRDVFEMSEALRSLDLRIDELRELGAAEQDLADFRRLTLQLLREDLLERARAAATARDGQDPFAELFDRYESFFQEAYQIARETAAAEGTTIEDAFRPLKDALDDLLAGDVMALVTEQLEDLVRAGDTAGIAALRDQLDTLLADLPPGVRAALEALLPEIFAAFDEAMSDAGQAVIDGFGLPADRARAEARELADQLARLEQALANGAITADQYAATFAGVAERAFVTLTGSFNSFLDDYYGQTAAGEELRRAAEAVTFAARFAQLQLEFELVQSLGLLTEEQIAQFAAAIQYVEDNWPDFSQQNPFPVRPGPTPPSAAVPTIDTTRQDLDAALADLDRWVAEISDADLDPLSRALAEIDRRGEELRDRLLDAGASMADLARLEQVLADARQQAIDQAFDAAREGLVTFLGELRRSDPRTQGGAAGFEAAQSRFRDLAARAATGDLEAMQQLEGAGRDLLARSDAQFGAGVGSLAVRDEITRTLERLTSAGFEAGDVANPVVGEVAAGNRILGDIRSILRGETTALLQARANNNSTRTFPVLPGGTRFAPDDGTAVRVGRSTATFAGGDRAVTSNAARAAAAAAAAYNRTDHELAAAVIRLADEIRAAERSKREAREREMASSRNADRLAAAQRDQHAASLAAMAEEARRRARLSASRLGS